MDLPMLRRRPACNGTGGSASGNGGRVRRGSKNDVSMSPPAVVDNSDLVSADNSEAVAGNDPAADCAVAAGEVVDDIVDASSSSCEEFSPIPQSKTRDEVYSPTHSRSPSAVSESINSETKASGNALDYLEADDREEETPDKPFRDAKEKRKKSKSGRKKRKSEALTLIADQEEYDIDRPSTTLDEGDTYNGFNRELLDEDADDKPATEKLTKSRRERKAKSVRDRLNKKLRSSGGIRSERSSKKDSKDSKESKESLSSKSLKSSRWGRHSGDKPSKNSSRSHKSEKKRKYKKRNKVSVVEEDATSSTSEEEMDQQGSHDEEIDDEDEEEDEVRQVVVLFPENYTDSESKGGQHEVTAGPGPESLKRKKRHSLTSQKDAEEDSNEKTVDNDCERARDENLDSEKSTIKKSLHSNCPSSRTERMEHSLVVSEVAQKLQEYTKKAAAAAMLSSGKGKREHRLRGGNRGNNQGAGGIITPPLASSATSAAVAAALRQRFGDTMKYNALTYDDEVDHGAFWEKKELKSEGGLLLTGDSVQDDNSPSCGKGAKCTKASAGANEGSSAQVVTDGDDTSCEDDTASFLSISPNTTQVKGGESKPDLPKSADSMCVTTERLVSPPVTDERLISNICGKILRNSDAYVSPPGTSGVDNSVNGAPPAHAESQISSSIVKFCMSTPPHDSNLDNKTFRLFASCEILAAEFQRYRAALCPYSAPPDIFPHRYGSSDQNFQQHHFISIKEPKGKEGAICRIEMFRVFKAFAVNHLEDILQQEQKANTICKDLDDGTINNNRPISLNKPEIDALQHCAKLWFESAMTTH